MSVDRFEWKNIRLVPILHNRLEFATEVREQFESFRPDQLAVEYPFTFFDFFFILSQGFSDYLFKIYVSF